MNLRKLFSNIGEDDTNRLDNENECLVSGFSGEREKMQPDKMTAIFWPKENMKRGRQQKPKIHTKRRVALNRCVAPMDCDDRLDRGDIWDDFFGAAKESCDYKDAETCHLCAGCAEGVI